LSLYYANLNNNETIAWITWVIGLMLMLNRVLGIHQTRASLKNVDEHLGRIAKVIDLRSECNVDDVSKLLDAYLNITEPEFRRVKDNIIGGALERLNQLRYDKRSEELATSEYYEWLLPILEAVGNGQTIKAVSCMFDAEWDDSPAERRFLQGNRDAALKGAAVERIFIMNPAILPQALANEAVGAHCEEKYQETKLVGYYADQIKLQSKEPELLKKAGHGFIIFDSRVALIDDFDEAIIRGRVTMNAAEIHTLEQTFQRLKVYSGRLSNQLVKPAATGSVTIPKPGATN